VAASRSLALLRRRSFGLRWQRCPPIRRERPGHRSAAWPRGHLACHVAGHPGPGSVTAKLVRVERPRRRWKRSWPPRQPKSRLN